MAKVRNATTDVINVIVKGGTVKNGIPETVGIQPGATENVKLDMDSAHTRGHIIAGALVIEGDEDAADRAALESPEGHRGAASAAEAERRKATR